MSQRTATWRWRGGRALIAVAIGAAALIWVLHDLDYNRFLGVVATASPAYLAAVIAAIIGEQLARAVKWRGLLYDLKPVGTAGLFGTLMASYFANLIVPGISSVVRAWLAARREDLKVTAVLATVAIERLIGGLVVTALVPFALLSVALPEPTGTARTALIWTAVGSFALFAALLCALAGYRAQVSHGARWFMWLNRRLPARAAMLVVALMRAFAEGIVWPKQPGRRFGIVLASVVMKLIAATQLMWAGFAVGVPLPFADYLFILVSLSLLHAFSISARMLGGFTIGAVIALGLFQVPKEQALAMALIVQGGNLLTVASLGGFVLWLQGIGLSDLRAAWVRLRDAVPADLPASTAHGR